MENGDSSSTAHTVSSSRPPPGINAARLLHPPAEQPHTHTRPLEPSSAAAAVASPSFHRRHRPAAGEAAGRCRLGTWG